MIAHLNNVHHCDAVVEHFKNEKAYRTSKNVVHENVRNLLFFSLMSSLSFAEYPQLLATANRCHVEIGDINHTNLFISKYCNYIDNDLKEETIEWAKVQNSWNVTLDIGTCTGLTLLAVIFISDKQIVRLVDIVVIISKKGIDLATVLFDVLQMKENYEPRISPEIVKDKLNAILGDGQFIKGNGPFKTALNKLVGKDLTYRWDPLHLFNRAHIKARGAIYKNELKSVAESSTSLEQEDYDWDEIANSEDTAGTASGSENTDSNTEMVRQLIKYIQKEAKVYRTGIRYTALLQYTYGQFKRPKVWSSTRMCLYEWNMIDRFLDNSIYFEIPLMMLITAKMYCLPMFGLKVLLKLAQKVDISYVFLKAYIFNLQEINYGKEFMIICLNIAAELALEGTFDELSKNLTKYEHDKHMIYLLREIEKYVKICPEKFIIQQSDISVRTTRQSSSTDLATSIRTVKSAIELYINNLWDQVIIRLDYTDTSFCTSFSEAPAESVFSIYDSVIHGRESISVKHATSLVRLRMQGPGVATKASLELSKKALRRHSEFSHLGERFCTEKWSPGLISSTVSKIQSKN